VILDTSALLAVLLCGSEAEQFEDAIETADVVRLSVAGYVEAAIYVDRRAGQSRAAMLDEFLLEFSIRLEPVTVEQGLAREAFLPFGKGRHAAGLNFGDCFTYALSKQYGEPVLFKGNDFRNTDLTPAIAEGGGIQEAID
jgi:ribonuclease VapC